MTPHISRLRGGLIHAALILVLVVLVPAAARAAPQASVVMDMRSGEILFARNHDTRLHPASLTKMMTLYIAFEAIRAGEITLDTPVRISAHAAGQPCSCLGLRAGQTIAMRHLIRAAALRSGNDAATAIGEAISGSDAAFVDRMNRTARAMGMANTTFRNAHGLTAPGHLSTARDMTILGRQLFFDFPEYYNLFSRPSADAGVRSVTNTNSAFLTSYRGADGIKTGFTRAAGFNLTASAERGGRRIIVTFFGGTSVPDRTRRVAELMDLGFQRAPAQVALRRPPTPAYQGPGRGGATAVAAAQPAPTAQPERPAAGRTIRLNTAVRRSPVPPLRPGPGGVALAALEETLDGIVAEVAGVTRTADAPSRPGAEAAAAAAAASVAAAVLASGTASAADAEPADAPAPMPRPDDLPFAVATDEPPEAEGLPVAAPLPRPEDGTPEPAVVSIAAAANAAEPAAAPLPRPEGGAELPGEVAIAEVADHGGIPAPMPRPEDAPAALISIAEAAASSDGSELAGVAPQPRSEGAEPISIAAAAEGSPRDPATGAAEPMPFAQADAPAPFATITPEAAEAALAGALAEGARPSDAGAASLLRAAPAAAAAPARPAPRPEERLAQAGIVLTFTPPPGEASETRLASLASAAWAEPATTARDIEPPAERIAVPVRNLSTSDPRRWAISLGSHTSRDAAERALMRAALAEAAMLEGALKRIERSGGGFTASFIGLSERQASLACERLRARQDNCALVAP